MHFGSLSLRSVVILGNATPDIEVENPQNCAHQYLKNAQLFENILLRCYKDLPRLIHLRPGQSKDSTIGKRVATAPFEQWVAQTTTR